MVSRQGLLLVVGSGGRSYREYLLAGAALRHRLWLLDTTEPSWQTPYIEGCSVVPLLDVARLVPDQDGLLKAALDVADRRPVTGVFTYDETLVVTAAHIAEALGLPGLTVAGAENCRNKYRSRTALTAAGLAQPAFARVGTLAEAEAAALQIGYPVVLKPPGMGASIGVVGADDPGRLPAAFQVAHSASYGGNPAYQGSVLVEQRLAGVTEVSIDGVVFDGRYQPLFLAIKTLGPAPYFEEVGHVVDPNAPLLADQRLVRMLDQAHRSLGVRYGATHAEVILTAGGPVIVEVNGRLGGDLIPYLGQLATRIDPGAVAADVATGRRPLIEPSPGPVVGIQFAYPPRDCRVRAVGVPAAGAAPGLVRAAVMAGPGTELRLPPRGYLGRYAYVICTAGDPNDCASRLDVALGQVGLEYDDPGPDPPGLLG